MREPYQLELDPLAISLTKPATRLGVPFLMFFSSIMVCMFGWIAMQAVSGINGFICAIVFLVIWVAMYAFMLLKSQKDIFGLHITYINVLHFLPHKTRSRWGNTDSYSP